MCKALAKTFCGVFYLIIAITIGWKNFPLSHIRRPEQGGEGTPKVTAGSGGVSLMVGNLAAEFC